MLTSEGTILTIAIVLLVAVVAVMAGVEVHHLIDQISDALDTLSIR